MSPPSRASERTQREDSTRACPGARELTYTPELGVGRPEIPSRTLLMNRNHSTRSIAFVTVACLALAAPRAGAASAPVAGGAAPVATVQPITVDLALDDFTDFGGAQTVADLPGPDGHVTFREAVLAANNTPGPQTIAFAIPTSEWSIFANDRAIIRIENMLYVSDDDTTVDFSTQTAFTGDTNPSGGEVGMQYAGPPASIPCLWLAADRCAVRGLDFAFGNNFSNTIWITGNENRVFGCSTNGLTIRGDYGGGALNVIGGTAPGDGNRFSEGVNILSGANDNILIGNTFHWGLRISGDTLYGLCERNRIGGASAAERNVLSGHGYYAEEGFPSGTQLEVHYATDTWIQGNYVGTTADGMAKYAGWSGTGGIVVGIGANGTTVRDNLVSGIVMVGSNHYQGQRFGSAIAVVASATNTTIVGNRIGVASDGTTPIPNVQGVFVQSDPNGTPNNVLFGGAAPSDANLVAFNETTGVWVGGTSSGVTIRRNSIRDNGGLGIDLIGLNGAGGGGVTPNDPLDGDIGGNTLQNYPVLSNASPTRVSGSLRSTPNRTFELEFFASPTCDPFGFGEGAVFVGAATVTTDSNGRVGFATDLALAVANGSVITATATDPDGNTSEFSACVTVSSQPGLRPIRR